MARKVWTLFYSVACILWLVDLIRFVFFNIRPTDFTIGVALFVSFVFMLVVAVDNHKGRI